MQPNVKPTGGCMVVFTDPYGWKLSRQSMRHFVLNADQHGKLQATIEMEGDASDMNCLFPSVH